MGEFRRSALALKSYRQPASTPSAAANAGAEKESPAEARPPDRRQKKSPGKGEMGCNGRIDGFLTHDRELAAA
jgi:hypothetical protein